MPERRLLVHTPAVQKAYMDGRFDVYILDKRRLAAGDRKRGGEGSQVQGEAHHEGRRDGDHRTL